MSYSSWDEKLLNLEQIAVFLIFNHVPSPAIAAIMTGIEDVKPQISAKINQSTVKLANGMVMIDEIGKTELNNPEKACTNGNPKRDQIENVMSHHKNEPKTENTKIEIIGFVFCVIKQIESNANPKAKPMIIL